jgi:Uma2 family endonuclease
MEPKRITAAEDRSRRSGMPARAIVDRVVQRLTGATTLLPQRLSWKQYLRMEEPPGFRLEFDEGKLIVSPSGVNVHQLFVAVLIAAFDEYEETGLGAHAVALPDTSHYMPPGERDYRPDVSVILGPRRSSIEPVGWMHGAPDIAIEVLSPSTRAYDLGTKARRYFENGSREYWTFDPLEEAAVFRRRGAKGWKEFKARGQIYRSPLLPGLRLDLKRLWARLARKLGRRS